MTDQMIQETIASAIRQSMKFNICWIHSNGNELLTAVTAFRKEELKAEGYWVAAIYEHGYQVDF